MACDSCLDDSLDDWIDGWAFGCWVGWLGGWYDGSIVYGEVGCSYDCKDGRLDDWYDANKMAEFLVERIDSMMVAHDGCNWMYW